MKTSWKGVFPAVTTKFTEKDKLDIPEMEKHFRFMLEAGVHGIIVTGSLGENSTLSFNEKLEVLKTAISVAGGKVPVLAGVAEHTTKKAQKMIDKGSKLGADGFMILPPMLYPTDERETLTHFQTVARSAPKPLMIYNNPVSYKVDVTPAMFQILASEESIVALKESSDNVRRITEIINLTGDRFSVFTGVDNLALESLAVGASGWVAGLVTAFPRETVAIYELVQQGNLQAATEIYRWFRPLLDLDVSTKLVQNIKLSEAIAGVSTERVRAPRLALAGEERKRVIKIVEDALAIRPDLSQYGF